ncbi:MAG: phosphoenolpyruvate carboxykinase (ATP) [Devosia sp.]
MLQSGADLQARLAASARLTEGEATGDLVAAALAAGEGRLTATGALAVTTGAFTGRSAKDKFIVRDGLTAGHVWWETVGALAPEQFDRLLEDALAYAAGRQLRVERLAAGADPAFRMGVTVVTETAWHALFIRNLLIRDRAADAPLQATILHLPGFTADPSRHGTRTGTVIALDMNRNIVLIAGTAYAGEIKKSVFSLFNFHAPLNGILSMHCSANVGAAGDTALFFGLSGTGKTTLSSDPARPLVGDDEHLWSDGGIANIEGGCYAKTAHLSPAAEPQIFAAARHFGTVLENVVVDPATGLPDYADLGLTENTRAAYPLSSIDGVLEGSRGGTPETVVFLTADAFGVLPPLARLSPEEAAYHFLSGYTAKIAGTERGITVPTATFSACFGAPFLSHRPEVYAGLLAQKLASSGARTWLVNTGWIGGSAGIGRRIDIASTRRLLAAVLGGELDDVPVNRDRVFGLAVPEAVPGLDARLLDPRANWSDGAAYDSAARELKALFEANYRRFAPAEHRQLETA